MSATTERDLACRAAKTDFLKALILARQVSEPWFRCQALACVARAAPEERVVATAQAAIAAALKDTDSYKQVAATAWPFRALIERDEQLKATSLLSDILALSTQIENPVSRSDALFLLWEAFFPVQSHNSVLSVLIRSCQGHWKADYLLRQIVLIMASESIESAREIIVFMRDGKYKRQAEKRLKEEPQFRAREFF